MNDDHDTQGSRADILRSTVPDKMFRADDRAFLYALDDSGWHGCGIQDEHGRWVLYAHTSEPSRQVHRVTLRLLYQRAWLDGWKDGCKR